MRDPQQYPKLRWPLDIRFEQISGQAVLILRCPLGITPQPLGLNAAVAGVLQSLDGLTSRADIMSRFGPAGLSEQLLNELLKLLSENLFLEGPAFQEARRVLLDAFAKAELREAALAGGGYPADAKDLLNAVDAHLAAAPSAADTPGRLTALIAPHIDYRRGSKGYSLAYRRLAGQKADLFVLLGIAHQYSPHLFHLTKKDFVIPFGRALNAKELVERLAAKYGEERSYADEILHKEEHSLELQLPFLLRVQPQARILPVLVGSLYECYSKNQDPRTYEPYESFVAALQEILSAEIGKGRKICLIAGVDMAHVGRHFGDKNSLTPEYLQQVRALDDEYLEIVSRRSADQLFAHIARDGDARHVCGFPAIFTLLDLLGRLNINYRTERLDYEQAVDLSADCAVTFASMGLYS